MGRETRLFKSQERKTKAETARFLRLLADKMEKDEVVLRQGGEEIALRLPGSLILEIQVEDEDKGAKGVQHSLEIEIKWFDGEQGGPVELG